MATATLVYGNKKTKRYHSKKKNDQCRQGEILKANLAKFVNVESAEDAGYKPCKACYPT